MKLVTGRLPWIVAAPLLVFLLAGCPQDTPVGDSKDDTSTAAPRVDAVTPNHGPTSGGTRVTIIGGPFESQIGVLFGAYAAVDPVIVNSRMITAIAPPQGAALVDVTVLSDAGNTTVVGAFRYEISQVDIISVSPEEGVITGGTAVTITGRNFSPNTLVKFGSENAGSISVLNPQLLTAVTPPHAAGRVGVEVISDGTSDRLDPAPDPNDSTDRLRGFLYFVPDVQITSIEPAFGPIEGGTQITIRGTRFPDGVGVLIGGSAATQVTRITDELITAIVPPGAGAGNVDVTLVYPGGQVVSGGAFEYTDGVMHDDGTDTDGDGLTDVQEMTGWEVWIDQFGLGLGVDTFGNVTRYTATSDPTNADTDSDGLDDRLEFLIRSDPRVRDTDGDGLWDGEEWNQWLTSPTAVDTDADARGDRNIQNAPNQALFDGMELFDVAVLRLPPGDPLRIVRPRATSPTLFDTDGDGVGDFDEFDSTVRNGVLADLPLLNYELVGDVDVRLNVEYAETVGQTKEYGVTLTESQTNTVASGFSSTFGWSLDVAVNGGYAEGSGYGGVEVTAGIHGEYTWSSSVESSRESSEEHSRLQSDSRELTETAADGEIRTAILLKNPGNTTFTLEGLGILVSQREKRKAPGDTSPETPPKTIATMTPVVGAVTLAPGETAGPFELAATGVNAQVIKELLALPDTLMLGTAAMDFHVESGLDFDFVRQFTAAQTATIVIDFGDANVPVRTYNVATNVDRNPDSSYRGISLRRVLEEMLGLPYGDAANGYTTRAAPSGRQALGALLGRDYAAGPAACPLSYWSVVVNNEDLVDLDFNDIILRAGDGVGLFFSRDDDGDCLSNTLEQAAGTDQGSPANSADADGDGLSDKFEVVDGWIAFEDPANPAAPHPDGFEKRRVFSSATAADTDNDGLNDAQEFAARSDPTDPDSDGDGLLDGRDPFPIRRAGTIFVKAGAAGGNGRAWATAVPTLQAALSLAVTGESTPGNPDDDVSQIWVARGTYKPASRLSPIALVNNVSIFGGFSGPDENFAGETKRGQRNTNAFTNGCVISGDLLGNDTGDISLDAPGTYSENCPALITAASNVQLSTLLDGFMITGAYATTADPFGGALNLVGSPTIQNCLITRNANQVNGAGVVTKNQGNFGGTPAFKKCIFAGNVARRGGGAYIWSSPPSASQRLLFEDCEFAQNEARRRFSEDDWQSSGGGVAIVCPPVGTPQVDFVRCAFTGNSAWCLGGGIYANGGTGSAAPAAYIRVDSCRFFSNSTTTTGWTGDWRGTGGGIALDADASVSNSVFWDNRSKMIGGAISVISGAAIPSLNGWWNGPIRRCTITNCTIVGNRSFTSSNQTSGGGVGSAGNKSNVLVQNTIAWNNWQGVLELPDDPTYEEQFQLYDWDWQCVWSVNNSCMNAGWPNRWRGINNNINDDPSIRGAELGDLRLGDESPCVDRGNSFVDVDTLLPGLQQLPQFDFFGNPRVVDGNSDGVVSVDIGAFEAPQQ